MNRIVFVIGHESSGCRLITRIIKQHGYKEKLIHTHAVYSQLELNEAELKEDRNRREISRRSEPYGILGEDRRFDYPLFIADKFKKAGWDIKFILTVRDKTIAKLSNTKNHCGGDKDIADSEMNIALKMVRDILKSDYDSFVFSYECFMSLGVDYLRILFDFLDIDEIKSIEKLIDGNEKYLIKPVKAK